MASHGGRLVSNACVLAFCRRSAHPFRSQFRRGFAENTKGDAAKPVLGNEKWEDYKKKRPPRSVKVIPEGGSVIPRIAPKPKKDIKTMPPSTEDPKRDPKEFPRAGIAYMGGIVNAQSDFTHTSWKPEKPITIAHAKAVGCQIHLPTREYYETPFHWKFGKSHLLLAIEWDYLHVWARPPDGQSFPPCDHARLSPVEFKSNYPFWVPPLHRMVPYADDWIITDLHTFFEKTQSWVPPMYEKAFDCRLLRAGTPEYDELVAKDSLAGKELTESDDSWVGPNYLQRLIEEDRASAKSNLEQRRDFRASASASASAS